MGLPLTKDTVAALAAAGIRLEAPAKPSWRFAPGLLIVEFEVNRRPVPWKAPTVTRSGHSFKDKRLVAWQSEVKACGLAAMAGLAPYAYPVRLSMQFYLSPRGGSPPDASNLGKACEDALQGPVIVNDRKVVEVRSERFLCQFDRAIICVYASEDQ